MHRYALLLAIALASLVGAASTGHAAQMASTRIASGLSSPVFVTAPAGDSRLFIVERAGRLKVLKSGAVLPTPFLDITTLVGSGGERGLLGLAFAPDYESTGFFYVYYVALNGDSIVARYQRSATNPDVADPTGRIVLAVPQPPAYSNHKGGTVAFGADGMLYLGLGDGGGSDDPLDNAQNGATLLGKMLRIDVRGPFSGTYTIPPDNPFASAAGDPTGAIRDEIWAKGLRNPFRFAFDRWTGDLWIGDVGQGQREEVDFEPASSPGGVNYGWRVMEGTRCNVASPPPAPVCNDPELTLPVVEYDHTVGCSITGGSLYRGVNLAIRGLYFYGDFCSGRIFTFDRATSQVVERTAELAPLDGTSIGSIVAISEGGGGELYITDLGGEIFSITLVPLACGLGGPELALGLGLLAGLRRACAAARRSATA